MFKFIKQYAASIKNVEIYPIFSLLVFFIFFVAVLYYVKGMDKQRVAEISNLPLQESNENSLLTQINNA
jgi:cytochrome c oxidase cbb3-type subunit IV